MFKVITLCALLSTLCGITLIILCPNPVNRNSEDTFTSTVLVIGLLNIWLGIITTVCGVRGILLNGDTLMNVLEKSSCVSITIENNELADVCITYNGEEHHFKISDNSAIKHHLKETYK
jgi:hypothetical protein